MTEDKREYIDELNQKLDELVAKEQYEEAIDLAKTLVKLTSEIDGENHPDYATSLNKLGILYYDIGDYTSAEPLYKKALEIRRKVLGEEHPDFANSLNNLGLWYDDMGDNTSAEPLFKQTLEIRRKVLGEEHPDFADSLNNLGFLYKTIGDYASAEPLYKQALEIRHKVLGEEHPNFANSLNILGLLYYAKGDYASAEPLYKKALEIRRKVLGEEHQGFADILNNLGLLYNDMGDYVSAEPLYRQALQIYQKVLGEEHQAFAKSLNNLGSLYDNMGDYASAGPLYKQALEIYQKVLGEEHPDFATSLNNFGMLYNNMGDYSSAEPLLKQALEIRRKVLGEDHPDFADSLDNLGVTYYCMSDYVSAEPLTKQALEIRRKILGEDSPAFAGSLGNLGTLYYKMGDYASAESLLKQALEIRHKVLGEDHPNFATSLSDLGDLYKAIGDYASAEPLYKQALEINRKVFGEEHPLFANCLRDLGSLYKTMGDYASAELLYKQALEIRRKVFGEEKPVFAESLNYLGELYHTMGNHASAELLYKQALEIGRKVLGEAHRFVGINLNNLGSLYLDMGDYASAESLYKQAMEISIKLLGEEHPSFATDLNNLGVLYHNMGNYASAEPLYKQALEIRHKVLGEEHPDFAWSLNDLAALYAATQREHESLLLKKQAAAIDERMIGQVFSIGSESQRMAFLKTLENNLHMFLSLVLQYFPHSTDAVTSACQLILKRKAIGAEVLAAQREVILMDAYPELTLKLKKLTDLRMQIAKTILAGPGPEGLSAHKRLLDGWTNQKENLESEIAKEIPEIKLEKRLRNSDIKGVSSLIPNKAALIEFFRFDVFNFKAIDANGDSSWNPPRYIAFILFHDDTEHIKMIDLGDAEPIDKLISDYRAELINNPSERPKRDMSFSQDNLGPGHKTDVGHQLRKILFDPFLEAIGDIKRFFIAPDGDLSRLPFEVLPLEDGRYLIDEYQISYLGVGRDLLRFEAEPMGSGSTPMVIADPDFDLGKDDESSFTQFNDKLIPISLKEDHQESIANQNTSAASPVAPKRSNIIAFPGTKLPKPEPNPTQDTGEQKIPLITSRVSRNFEGSDIIFNRLPGTKEEGEVIAGMLNVQPMMNNQALESSIKNCRSPKILHIASHGFFLADQERKPDYDQRAYSMLQPETGSGLRQFSASKIENPMLRSGLALAGVNTWLKGGHPPAEAEDGILTAEDVTGLDLTATELVVLSACETGLGEIKTGEGVFGLRRAFAIAGAKTLVMSLWKVPDKQTKELMIDFYNRIINGEARSNALKNAQQKIRKHYPDPYYWGAFICQGNPGPLADNIK